MNVSEKEKAPEALTFICMSRTEIKKTTVFSVISRMTYFYTKNNRTIHCQANIRERKTFFDVIPSGCHL